jgi:hypothetical protein
MSNKKSYERRAIQDSIRVVKPVPRPTIKVTLTPSQQAQEDKKAYAESRLVGSRGISPEDLANLEAMGLLSNK